MSKLTIAAKTTVKSPATSAKKTPAKVAAPKDGASKIQQVLEKPEAKEVTAGGKVVKSFTQMVPTESGRRQVGHKESEKVIVGKENSAKSGTARHTAIALAQSCKTAGELYAKLATNWVNWILKEGYVAIG